MATKKKKKHRKRRRLIIHPRFFLVVALLVLAIGVLVLLLVSIFSGGSAAPGAEPIQSTEQTKKGGIFQIFAKETPTPVPTPTPTPTPRNRLLARVSCKRSVLRDLAEKMSEDAYGLAGGSVESPQQGPVQVPPSAPNKTNPNQ